MDAAIAKKLGRNMVNVTGNKHQVGDKELTGAFL